MKKMFACVFCIFQAYGLYGQDSLQVSSHAKSAAVVFRMSREVKLNNNQEELIYDVMQKRWSELERVKAGKGPFSRDVIDRQTLAALRKILTAQQFSTFMTLREERRKHKSEFKSKNPRFKFDEVDSDLDF